MEERDYLKRQLDQLGRVLGMLIARLLGTNPEGQMESQAFVNQALNDELQLDIPKIIDMESEYLLFTLTNEKNLNNDNLEKLAYLFLLLTEDENNLNESERKNLLQKSLIIYEYLQATSDTFSFERHTNIERIKANL